MQLNYKRLKDDGDNGNMAIVQPVIHRIMKVMIYD